MSVKWENVVDFFIQGLAQIAKGQLLSGYFLFFVFVLFIYLATIEILFLEGALILQILAVFSANGYKWG